MVLGLLGEVHGQVEVAKVTEGREGPVVRERVHRGELGPALAAQPLKETHPFGPGPTPW